MVISAFIQSLGESVSVEETGGRVKAITPVPDRQERELPRTTPEVAYRKFPNP